MWIEPDSNADGEINFARSVTNTHDSSQDTYRRDESPNASISTLLTKLRILTHRAYERERKTISRGGYKFKNVGKLIGSVKL